MLDFDGSLAPIVSRPEDAGPAPGAREVLADLVVSYRLVGVISGRPVADLERMLGDDGVRYEGLYGLAATTSTIDAIRAAVEGVARAVQGAWVEPKGVTLAVHYRQAEDPADARAALEPPLETLAKRSGYDLLEGKMVFELAPAGESRKGGAVERLVAEHDLRAVLYAGDDLPDLEAFAALDRLSDDGLVVVKVAVGGPETPEALSSDADLVVDGPSALVTLLGRLAVR